LLERDTHPKGEKQNGLTESVHHCTIVLLYEFGDHDHCSDRVRAASVLAAARPASLIMQRRFLGLSTELGLRWYQHDFPKRL